MRYSLRLLAIIITANSTIGAEINRTHSLRAALAGADRLFVKDHGKKGNSFELTGAAAIAELVTRLEFDDSKSGQSCFCDGDSRIEFYATEIRIVTLCHHHGHSIRWVAGPWMGDSVFTPESAAYWRTWFKEKGDSRFEDMFVKGQNEAASKARFLGAFTPKAAAILGAPTTDDQLDESVIFFLREGRKPDQINPISKRFASEFTSNRELGRAACRAFGSLASQGADGGSWGFTRHHERLVLDALKKMDETDFEAVLIAATNDEKIGVARLFFAEDFDKKLNRTKRSGHAAILARTLFQRDLRGNSTTAILKLKSYTDIEVRALLTEVADNKITVASANGKEPSPRALACLALAQMSDPRGAKIGATFASEPHLSLLDVMACKLTRILSGLEHVDASLFKTDSIAIASGTIAALEKQGDRDAIDSIVHWGLVHPKPQIIEEALCAMERVISMDRPHTNEKEDSNQSVEEIRKWWSLHREQFQPKPQP